MLYESYKKSLQHATSCFCVEDLNNLQTISLISTENKSKNHVPIKIPPVDDKLKFTIKTVEVVLKK